MPASSSAQTRTVSTIWESSVSARTLAEVAAVETSPAVARERRNALRLLRPTAYGATAPIRAAVRGVRYRSGGYFRSHDTLASYEAEQALYDGAGEGRRRT